MDYTQFKTLEFRRKFWVLVGAKIYVTDPTSEQQVGFINMKAWKLKEDIRLYSDESMTREVLHIHARNVIDFGATYDVFESNTDNPLFSLRRKGLKSTFVRDHWDLSDAQGNVFGAIQETSGALALARRWVGVIPFIGDFIDLALAFAKQTYVITHDNKAVATIVHHKNPLVVKMSLDTSMSDGSDPRISIAATALLSVIDAAKNN